MKRKDFLKAMGVAGIGLTVPIKASSGSLNSGSCTPPACVLIPTETAGPFPLDLTENSAYFRQDIREDQAGVQLNLKLKIKGLENCAPMPNLRVNIWHCNKDGLYSGYSQSNNQGQTGKTYLRGYQYTDANGEVDFVTILPGWYNGRICHIHFQVYVSSSYAAISQLTFPLDIKNQIFTNNSSLYTKGADPLSFSQDNIFSDGYEYQLSTLTPNENGNGYDAYLEVTIKGEGVLGVSHVEKQTAKNMVLEQNFPNPYMDQCTIPFSVLKSSKITLQLWDLSGRKVAILIDKKLYQVGNYIFDMNKEIFDISNGSYVYEIIAENSDGIFKTSKMMTRVK